MPRLGRGERAGHTYTNITIVLIDAIAGDGAKVRGGARRTIKFSGSGSMGKGMTARFGSGAQMLIDARDDLTVAVPASV